MASSIWESVLGHKNQKSRLQAAVKNERLASTMFFFGPRGVGKKKLAVGLAQSLLSDDSRDGACGK